MEGLTKKSFFKLLILCLGLATLGASAYTKYEDSLIQAVAKGDANALFKGINYCKNHFVNLPFSLTPTGIHLKNNLWAFDYSVVQDYVANPELMDVVSQVIKKERDYAQKGYYTFVHGQRRAYLLSERIYSFLWQLRKNKITQDFLFAHVKPLLVTPEQLQEEEEMRLYLLEHGRKPKDPVTRQKLLFLNFGLFNQIKDKGSNTAYYVSHNINWGSAPIHITTYDAFKLLGYESIYYKYESQLKALDEAYTNGSYGNILMIAIPRDVIHKYAFLCHAGKGSSGIGGVKREISIPGIGTTSDIRIIMKTLMENPTAINSDDLEFCLIMTQHEGGLDPHTGIKIDPIITGDIKHIEQLAQIERKLCELIRLDIQAHA